MAKWLSFLLLGWCVASAQAADWADALRVMPLAEPAREINDTNFARLMLNSFRSNSVVKGIVLMPGATDEFYFFHRGNTKLGAGDTNLLAAITALTNNTRIRVLYRAPLLLLHTAEDPLVPDIKVKNEAMVARLREMTYVPHANYNDRDWDFIRPILLEHLDATFWPPQLSKDSWHFYRHSFAGWNLNGWETLEAIALAGKSSFTVEKTFFQGRPKLTFVPDTRIIKQ
jgi:hypothetical protein